MDFKFSFDQLHKSLFVETVDAKKSIPIMLRCSWHDLVGSQASFADIASQKIKLSYDPRELTEMIPPVSYATPPDHNAKETVSTILKKICAKNEHRKHCCIS